MTIYNMNDLLEYFLNAFSLPYGHKKYFVKKFRDWTNYIKPTITIHKFIVHMKMNGSDIRVSFEVESMVCGYHCYSTMQIGEEPPCKLNLNI